MSKRTELHVSYCPELGVWSMENPRTGASKVVAPEDLAGVPERLTAIFDAAKADPETVRVVTFA